MDFRLVEEDRTNKKMSTKTPLPTVNEKVTESVSINGVFIGLAVL